MRFPMTLDTRVKVITALVVVLIVVVLPLQGVALFTAPVPAGARLTYLSVMAVVAGALLLAVALAPRGVRLSLDGLAVERLLWPDFVVPWSEVQSAEEGPELRPFGNAVRVAGNGGLMGFSGLYAVKGVGTVRCWATRLYTPTVVVRRSSGRPVLLGVDDPAGLLAELRKRVGVLSHRHG